MNESSIGSIESKPSTPRKGLFSIYIGEHENGEPSRNTANLAITARIRTSGFLRLVPPEDLKNLAYLLTFVRPDGRCEASLQQLAQAMGVSVGRARARMEHLSQMRWNGSPIIRPARRLGAEVFQLAPVLVDASSSPTNLTADGSQASSSTSVPVIEQTKEENGVKPIVFASSETVVEVSRQKHGTPREAVERNVADQMGWEYPFRSPNEIRREAEKNRTETESSQATEASDLKSKLVSIGITEDQMDSLLAEFPHDRIRQQITWLPLRNAKNKASLLIAAIRDNYEAPASPSSGRGRTSHG